MFYVAGIISLSKHAGTLYDEGLKNGCKYPVVNIQVEKESLFH